MSTSTDARGAGLGRDDLLAAAAGLPGAAELARLATALFAAGNAQPHADAGPAVAPAWPAQNPQAPAAGAVPPGSGVPAVPDAPSASAGGSGLSGPESPGVAAGAPAGSVPLHLALPVPPLALPETGVPTSMLPASVVPAGLPPMPAFAGYTGFAQVPGADAGLPAAAAFAATPSFYFAGTGDRGTDHPGTSHSGTGAPSSQLPAAPGRTGLAPFDVDRVRRDFPILSERVEGGRPLVWLDNAATTQKPRAVIERLRRFYERENSNIHRAAHALAARATDAYEAARETVRAFIGARSVDEVVFVRGATEAINLVAQSWGRQHVGAGDEIVVSWLEHHANIVPWQRLAHERGATLKVIPVDDNGDLRFDDYLGLLSPRTRLVAFTQVSNALGTVTPAAQIVAAAHAAGARVLVDGAQSVSHMRTDVAALDADWFVFSGHKVFAPTGIGVLYGKRELLDATEPWQAGGNMIEDVSFERTRYQAAPARFEAGTGNIADAAGLAAALDYVDGIGIDAIHLYEQQLIRYASLRLEQIRGVRIVGHPVEKAGVISFVVDGYETPEVGAALSRAGIAVRAGHHCAQPILRRFGLEASVRPSFAPYNTCADIDALVTVIADLSHGRSVRVVNPWGLPA